MKARVELADQVLDFLRRLAPAPRRAVRAALRELEKGSGDTQALEGELSGYWRVRAGKYRVIFAYGMQRGQQVAQCVYAAERSIVYEVFSERLRQEMSG